MDTEQEQQESETVMTLRVYFCGEKTNSNINTVGPLTLLLGPGMAC